MPISEKVYEYQMQLINRRWQYFATYLFLMGFIANALPKELWDPVITFKSTIITKPFILLSISGVILGLIFTQLISKATERIEKIEKFIGSANTITNLPLDGKFMGIFSETILLYIVIYCFSAMWVFILFQCSITFFIICCGLLFLNLFALKWMSITKN